MNRLPSGQVWDLHQIQTYTPIHSVVSPELQKPNPGLTQKPKERGSHSLVPGSLSKPLSAQMLAVRHNYKNVPQLNFSVNTAPHGTARLRRSSRFLRLTESALGAITGEGGIFVGPGCHFWTVSLLNIFPRPQGSKQSKFSFRTVSRLEFSANCLHLLGHSQTSR